MLCSSCLPCCANCVLYRGHLHHGHGVHCLSHFTTAYGSWFHVSNYGGNGVGKHAQIYVSGRWTVLPRPLPVNVDEDYVCVFRAL